MAFGKQAHDCDHASAQCRSHKVGWRKGGAFPAIIDRSIRHNSATGRGMNSLSLQLPIVFDLDFDHGEFISPTGQRRQELRECASYSRNRPRRPRDGGELMRCVIAQRLEGSRFGAYPANLATFVSSLVRPKRAKRGGSRERPIGSQLYGPDVNESKAMGKCVALGYSREPPVATFFGRIEHSNEYREGRRLHAKAAPLQALGTNRPCQRANPFDDDLDDYEIVSWPRSLIALQICLIIPGPR
jgi:hypothetical protein